jgi:hypothetical protein
LTYRNSDLQGTGHPKVFLVREAALDLSGAKILDWAMSLGEKTRPFSISAREFVNELREAGFLSTLAES